MEIEEEWLKKLVEKVASIFNVIVPNLSYSIG